MQHTALDPEQLRQLAEQFDWLITHESALQAVLDQAGDRTLQAGLVEQIAACRKARGILRQAADPDREPEPEIVVHRGHPNREVLLAGERIGWIHEATQETSVDRHPQRAVVYHAYRPNKWMYKKPSYVTVDKALQRILDEWRALSKIPSSDDTPPTDSITVEPLSDASIQSAIAIWIRIYRNKTGRDPSHLKIARTFFLDESEVAGLLSISTKEPDNVG